MLKREQLEEIKKKISLQNLQRKIINLQQRGRNHHQIQALKKRAEDIRSGRKQSSISSKHDFDLQSKPSSIFSTHQKTRSYSQISSPTQLKPPTASLYKKQIQNIQGIHHRARQIIQNQQSPVVPAKLPDNLPPLNQKVVKIKSEDLAPLKLPVYIPESTYRKTNRLPPHAMNRVTSTGEVFTVYMVGDPGPAFDPLVKVQTIIQRSSRPRREESVIVQADSEKEESLKSQFKSSPRRRKEEKTVVVEQQLTPAPRAPNYRVTTPKLNDYSHNFRDHQKLTSSVSPERKWVRDRIKMYSDTRVKRDFLPKISPSKRTEIQLRQLPKSVKQPFKKVKLDEISQIGYLVHV